MMNESDENDFSEISQNYRAQNITPKDDASIYNLIENVRKDNDDKIELSSKNEQKFFKHLEYISTVLMSVVIYSFCISISKIPFQEVTDLELALIIAFTLILTKLTENDKILPYVIFIFLGCIIFFVDSTYAFFLFVSIIAVICVKCMKKIQLNEHDYKIQ